MPRVLHSDIETRTRIAQLRELLARGPMTVEALMNGFGVSQPTMSRWLREAGQDVSFFRTTGDRTPRYALIRPVAGSATPKAVYRVTENGTVADHAVMTFFRSGHTHVSTGSGTLLYEGLPPSMTFAAPSGFIGRQVAEEARKHINVPASIRDWQDEHKTEYLFNLAFDTPGDLVFGEASLSLALSRRADAYVVPAAKKLDHYLSVTRDVANQAAGSSAGGEQPKFLCETEDRGHVIVKFAREGTRMAWLLHLEHLALETLSAHGVPAASSRLLSKAGTTFLEVQRFDRIGRHGRRGMLSAGAFDDEHFGHRDNWSAFADRCVSERVLKPADAKTIHTLAAFSELIGNTDTHFENLSLLTNWEGDVEGVAPAYDMLPMRYATVGGGIDPDLAPLTPKLGVAMSHLDAWKSAYRAADDFWAHAERIREPGFQALARANRESIRLFAEPLLAGAQHFGPSETKLRMRRT